MIKVNDNSDSVGERVQLNINDLAMLATAPSSDWSDMSESEHFVQFYETDAFLLDSLGGFISAGLSADEACIVVANNARRKPLEKNLQVHGHDVTAAFARGQYIFLDAAETLAKFMVDARHCPNALLKSLQA